MSRLVILIMTDERFFLLMLLMCILFALAGCGWLWMRLNRFLARAFLVIVVLLALSIIAVDFYALVPDNPVAYVTETYEELRKTADRYQYIRQVWENGRAIIDRWGAPTGQNNLSVPIPPAAAN